MNMNTLNIDHTKEMMAYVAKKMMESKALLCEIDGKTGDGDHGLGIERGFSAVDKLISNRKFDSVNAIFKESGMAMMNSMGGASGIIFSAIFLGILKLPVTDLLTPLIFTTMCEEGLAKIKKVGKAKIGDKTMIDAFEPAIEAMKAVCESADFETLFRVAEDASVKGMEATKNFIAAFGRAKFLGERSLGFQDAGATSVSIIFHSMYEYVTAN